MKLVFAFLALLVMMRAPAQVPAVAWTFSPQFPAPVTVLQLTVLPIPDGGALIYGALREAGIEKEALFWVSADGVELWRDVWTTSPLSDGTGALIAALDSAQIVYMRGGNLYDPTRATYRIARREGNSITVTPWTPGDMIYIPSQVCRMPNETAGSFGNVTNLTTGRFFGLGVTSPPAIKKYVLNPPAFRLAADVISGTQGSNFVISWASSVGGSYVVEQSADLQTWTPASQQLAGTGERMQYSSPIPANGADALMWRVVVK